MKLTAIVAVLFVVIILLAGWSASPIVQYFGNALGVLLGFTLGLWGQDAEKRRADQAKRKMFWKEFTAFLSGLESEINNQIAQTSHIFDSVFEHRLPLADALYFANQAQAFGLDEEFCTVRRELSQLVRLIRILEEYVDQFATNRIEKPHPNFRSYQQRLWESVIKMKERYSSNKAF